jgi:hypothetical protein
MVSKIHERLFKNEYYFDFDSYFTMFVTLDCYDRTGIVFDFSTGDDKEIHQRRDQLSIMTTVHATGREKTCTR